VKVDVVVCTYNSEKYLEECLKSIKKYIPVNRLIVVDHFSKDSTPIIAEDYADLILWENQSLGFARQLGISKVTTPYFLFVDSDVVIKGNKWLEQAYDYLCSFDDLAAVVLDIPSSYAEGEKIKTFWNKFGRINTNFFCINTLIRTKAVRGIKIPFINSGEDKYIGDWLIQNGWKYLLLKNDECFHFVDYSDRKSQWSGAGDRVYYGLRILPKVFVKLLMSPIRGLLPSLIFKDIKIFVWNTRYLTNYLKGFLNFSKYRVLKRKGRNELKC